MLGEFYRFVVYNGTDQTFDYTDSARIEAVFTPWTITDGEMEQLAMQTGSLIDAGDTTVASGAFKEGGADYENTDLAMGFTGTLYIKNNTTLNDVATGDVSLYLEISTDGTRWPSESTDVLSAPPDELIHLVTIDVEGGDVDDIEMENFQFGPRTTTNTGGMKPHVGIPLESQHPLVDGLVSAIVMNESAGNIVYDLSKNKAKGTVTGATWTAGDDGTVLTFNGSSDNIQVLPVPLVNPPFTMFVKYKPAVSASWKGVMSLNAGSSNHYTIHQMTLGGVYFVARDTGTDDRLIFANGYVLNEWNTAGYIVASDSSRYGYCNGVMSSEDTTTVNPNDFTAFEIGESAGSNFQGEIACAYLYDRVLTIDELSQLELDPYQMFRREPWELWSYVAAAGGLDIPIAMYHYLHNVGSNL